MIKNQGEIECQWSMMVSAGVGAPLLVQGMRKSWSTSFSHSQEMFSSYVYYEHMCCSCERHWINRWFHNPCSWRKHPHCSRPLDTGDPTWERHQQMSMYQSGQAAFYCSNKRSPNLNGSSLTFHVHSGSDPCHLCSGTQADEVAFIWKVPLSGDREKRQGKPQAGSYVLGL